MTISRLRKLVAQCGEDTDAVESICYHGSLALLFEFDQDWSSAVKHRELEIRKIRRLHKLEERNPTNGYATQNYQAEDLSERLEILQQIKRKRITEMVQATATAPVTRMSIREHNTVVAVASAAASGCA